jgi:hypothetical protein
MWGLCASVAAAQDASTQPAEPPSSKVKFAETSDTPGDAKNSEFESSKNKEKSGTSSVKQLSERFLADQQSVWTSPAKLRFSDLGWIAPAGGLTAAFLVTDKDVGTHLPSDSKTISHYKTMSDAGLAAFVGGAAGMWFLGHPRHSEHWRETGFLAGEAALNSLIAVESMKYPLGRQRPYEGNGDGPFFSHGTSFPSEHAAASWAIAGVIAHEYHGWLTKLGVYSLAALVDYSRIRARQHFPSDVLVGSIVGNLVAQNIYSRHYDPELGGASWDSWSSYFREHWNGDVRSMGSTYVPVESWVYGAFERLQALGYANTAFLGLKPWARTECARLLAEAQEQAAQTASYEESARLEEARKLINGLEREFQREEGLESGDSNFSAGIGSVYARVTNASGPVLTDGYHFGQTFGYDVGRPFERGTNWVSGMSQYFTSGRFFLFLQEEYQHAPGAPALSTAEQLIIAQRDKTGLPPAGPFSSVNQLNVMDGYFGFNFDNWQVSLGKQSLSWNVGEGGSLILSDNAEPFYMLRMTQVHPIELPSFLSFFGPVRLETFIGRERGHDISGSSFLYGQKFIFKPLRSFEFSYSRTTTLGGFGDPFTLDTFLRSYFGRVYYPSGSTSGSVPGDSHTDVDWTWRPPQLHDRVVFYGELEDDDDTIPFQNLTKSVLRPGVYIPNLPWLPKWDLHAEWTSSESPGRKPYQAHGNLNYWNGSYRDGYTNYGNLVGNIVGREGKGAQAWTRYWISSRNTLDLTVKLNEVDNDFIPGGGKYQDYRATYEQHFRSGAYVRSFVQFERISHYPLLFPHAENNVTTSLEVGFEPLRKR